VIWFNLLISFGELTNLNVEDEREMKGKEGTWQKIVVGSHDGWVEQNRCNRPQREL